MKLAVLQQFVLILILSFLQVFKTLCFSNAYQERVAMWLLDHFLKCPPKAAVAHHLFATKNKDHRKENSTTYLLVVIHLLYAYETHNIIAEAKAEIINVNRTSRMSAVRSSEVLLDKIIRHGLVNEEACFKVIFIERQY